jgi:hypothetical protein
MSTINSRITPISDGYPTCSECYAQLLIYPGAMHPDDVSKLLGLEPTQKNIAGTVVTNSRGKTREIKLSGWFLSSEQYVQSKDLREHIDWLLEKIKPLKKELIKLQNIDGITLGIDCVWRSAVGHGGPTLWPEQMRSISDLDLECSFDIYFDPEGSTSQ